MAKKLILITGASRGIGFETAKSVADSGHNVIATARSKDALETLKTHSPGLIDTVAADLTDPGGVAAISDHLSQRDQTLDGLVHNAGLLINRPFPDLTDDDWHQMLEVNLMGPVRLTRALITRMEKGGHVVNISSMGGYQESSKYPGLTGYSTAKGALSILTECLAVELAGLEICVNCLCLGAVQTEMLQEAFPGLEAPVTSAQMGDYVSEFVLQAHRFYNGKILPVALSDPG
jgi:3-oxoacyl-[acyl-carrier protein] reductase